MASLRHVPLKCRGPRLFAVIYPHLTALTLNGADTHVVTVDHSHVLLIFIMVSNEYRESWKFTGIGINYEISGTATSLQTIMAACTHISQEWTFQ